MHDHSDFMTSQLHCYRREGARIRRMKDLIRREVLKMQIQQWLSEGGCELSKRAYAIFIKHRKNIRQTSL